MSKIFHLARLGLLGVLLGCAAYQVAGQVQSGRMALLVKEPERALPYFLEAAKGDPNYVYYSSYYREGIWTYLGRSQYATKRYSEARQSLERALSLDRDDNLARLYLGLTLARSDELLRGVKEIHSAMKGLYDWIEYINRTRSFEAYWDPAREIRKAIEKDIAPGNDLVNPEQLIADAEWLGYKMEDEIENVRRDKQRRFDRNIDRRRGVSVGVGF